MHFTESERSFARMPEAKAKETSGLRVACWTLGCKVNGYESQAMLEQFLPYHVQIVSRDEPADIYLVNTCTVTQTAAKKSRQMIRRMKALHPEALIVACGCYVDQDLQGEESLSDIADLCLTNQQKTQAAAIVMKHLYPCENTHGQAGEMEEITALDQLRIASSGEKTRAFLKIQDGCRQYCSYCIIPYVRGPLSSKKLQDVVSEALDLAEGGCREIVLTGIHLSSYGKDLDDHPSLSGVIKAIADIKTVDRIRLGSLEVGLMTEAFINEISDIPKLCPHFQLSLQSGCDRTLKAMNRRYSTEAYRNAVERLRTAIPGAAVTTDVIAGYPGETEEDHRASIAFVRDMRFSAVHVFPYSARAGTPAAKRTDQVDPMVKSRRTAEMLLLAGELSGDFHRKQLHQVKDVLVEQYDAENGVSKGYTADYCHVHIRGDLETNRIYPIYMNELVQSGHEPFLMGVLQ